MVTTDTIRDYIIDPMKTPLIRQAIQEGVSQYRMQSFDQALASLAASGLITTEEAVRNATRPHELALHIQGVSGAASRAWSQAEPPAADKRPPDSKWVHRDAA
jgi:twitching motility protein PilT